MSYQEDYEKAQKAGKTDEISRNIQSWSEEGETLVGKCVSIGPFLDGTFETEVNAYMIDTDDGLVSTVLGSATDNQIKDLDLVGRLVYIEYRGKKSLKDGKQVNHFKIQVF